MPSSEVILVSGKSVYYFRFSDTESGSLFMPILGVVMFKDVFYKSNKKM
jgi:hypothetical protein